MGTRSSDLAAEFVPLGGSAPPARAFRPLVDPGADAPSHETADAAPASDDPGGGREQFQAGYDLGRREALAEVAPIAESLVQSLESLAVFRGDLRRRYERELLQVALGVARKVVQQELQERPEIWLGMIRAAIGQIVDRDRVTVRVPHQLAEFLRATHAELRAQLDGVKELEVIEDASLPLGGCVIESRFGELDAGVDTQFEAAAQVLGEVEE